jgi:hypothetical protein
VYANGTMTIPASSSVTGAFREPGHWVMQACWPSLPGAFEVGADPADTCHVLLKRVLQSAIEGLRLGAHRATLMLEHPDGTVAILRVSQVAGYLEAQLTGIEATRKRSGPEVSGASARSHSEAYAAPPGRAAGGLP